MLNQITDHDTWLEYLDYKIERHLLNKNEGDRIREYILTKAYLPEAQAILDGCYEFPLPEKKELNKIGTNKKRIVYSFPFSFNMILKLVSYLLYRYDSQLSDKCFSFRTNQSSKKAFTALAEDKHISNMYGYKTDIHNYFNSIEIDKLIPRLKLLLCDDPQMYYFLKEILSDRRVLWEGQVIFEDKGAMAGTPISPFIANFYLTDLDNWFSSRGISYARYSDDIIVFDEKERIELDIRTIEEYLGENGLSKNEEKTHIIRPGEPWEFLGFRKDGATIDISTISRRKLFGKIRRASRSIRRWMIKGGKSSNEALRVFNNKFNSKFYLIDNGHDLCWTRWYFPIINTSQTLHEIDKYMQECQRYIVTGKHNKRNYSEVPYSILKECGYRPLVTEYYNYIEGPSLN